MKKSNYEKALDRFTKAANKASTYMYFIEENGDVWGGFNGVLLLKIDSATHSIIKATRDKNGARVQEVTQQLVNDLKAYKEGEKIIVSSLLLQQPNGVVRLLKRKDTTRNGGITAVDSKLLDIIGNVYSAAATGNNINTPIYFEGDLEGIIMPVFLRSTDYITNFLTA